MTRTKVNRFYEFETLCKMRPNELKAHVTRELNKLYPEVISNDGYVYAKGSYPVVLVAHLDTVHKDYRKWFNYTEKSNKISSPQGIGGDDRCGVYMILDIIKEIPCSVIFCEEEEVGCVGAYKFAKDYESAKIPSVEANYIIEFDRRGYTDAVYYDLDNKEFEKFISESSKHFKTDLGSCSDISDIAPAMGIAAVNLSCGYYKEHTKEEYVLKSQMLDNIGYAREIINTQVDKPFEYKERAYHWKPYSGLFGYNTYDDYDRYDVWSEPKDEPTEYEIYFTDTDGMEAVDYYEAISEYEAIGMFVTSHPNIPYSQVLYQAPTYNQMYSPADRTYIDGKIFEDVSDGLISKVI